MIDSLTSLYTLYTDQKTQLSLAHVHVRLQTVLLQGCGGLSL